MGLFCLENDFCLTTDLHEELNVFEARKYCKSLQRIQSETEFNLLELRSSESVESVEEFFKNNQQFEGTKVVLDGLLMETETWFWTRNLKNPSKPLKVVDEENYVYIDSELKFRGSQPSYRRSFICQSTRSPSGCQLQNSSWKFEIFLPDLESCFYFVLEPKLTWFEARMECLKLKNTDLAVTESEILLRQISIWFHQVPSINKNSSFWIGLTKNRWIWSSNNPDDDGDDDNDDDMKVTNWKEGFPKSQSSMKCVYIAVNHSSGNKWINAPCDNPSRAFNVICSAKGRMWKHYETFETSQSTWKLQPSTEHSHSDDRMPVGIIAAVSCSAIFFVAALLILLAVLLRHKCRRFAKNDDLDRLDSSSFTFQSPELHLDFRNQQVHFRGTPEGFRRDDPIVPDLLPTSSPKENNFQISDDYSSIGESHFGVFNSESGNQMNCLPLKSVTEGFREELKMEGSIEANKEDELHNHKKTFIYDNVEHMTSPNGDLYAIVIRK